MAAIVSLRSFTESEYHQFYRNYIPDISVSAPFSYDREQVSRSYYYNYSGIQKNYMHLGIFENEKPVGAFQLKRIDTEKKRCEFGLILLNEDCRCRGIGTAAVMEGIRIASRQFGIETIAGDTMGRNLRMRRVFEKLGFDLIETVPDTITLYNGEKDDRLVFEKKLVPEG